MPILTADAPTSPTPTSAGCSSWSGEPTASRLTVPDSERRSTVMELGMDPLQAQIRQVCFFDMPDLTLNTHGVDVRARRVVPRALPDGLRRSKNLVLDDLSMLGRINLLKLKFSPEGFGRRLVAELWMYPDGSRILELSTKCAPAAGFDVAAESRAFLASRGIDLFGEHQTKTALEFFSRNRPRSKSEVSS
jgi:hypothetical protein